MAGHNLFLGVVSLGLIMMIHPARGAKSTGELYNTSKAMLQVSRLVINENSKFFICLLNSCFYQLKEGKLISLKK